MFSTTHTVVAIALTRFTNNPALAFGIAFLSHIFLDMIPHGDRTLMMDQNTENVDYFVHLKSKKIKKYVIISILDLTLLILLYLYLIKFQSFNPTLLAIIIFGAILIDMISGINYLTRWKFLNGFTHWHKKIHKIINSHLPNQDISLLQGIGLQILIVVVVLFTISK